MRSKIRRDNPHCQQVTCVSMSELMWHHLTVGHMSHAHYIRKPSWFLVKNSQMMWQLLQQTDTTYLLGHVVQPLQDYFFVTSKLSAYQLYNIYLQEEGIFFSLKGLLSVKVLLWDKKLPSCIPFLSEIVIK